MSGPLLMMAMMLACSPGDLACQPSPPIADSRMQSVALLESDAPAHIASSADEESAADLEAIVVTARRHSKADPLESVNLKTFAVALAVDSTFIAPTAHAYQRTVPEPMRMGVRNFFRNLHEPVVFLNFLLQLKPGRALKTLGRFAVNTTVGGAGLFDMAKRKPFNLPYRPNGFANTLAYYGVKPGAFLFLPLIGPTTVRDLAGLGMDTMTMPLSGTQPITGPVYTASSTAVKAIDGRAEGDEALQNMIDGHPNEYATIREAYLARRQAEVDELHGVTRVAQGDTPRSAASPLR